MLKLAIAWALIIGCLKVSGVVAWSWWAVFGPLAAVGATVLVLLILVGGCAVAVARLQSKINKLRK